ncbi:uncharacterized protein BDW70DRAFT_76462 [Aspergillus foveolatus]|uniref:uncharacterized protein n=1 Tax=Aspergillus foveolatus TaxID=210207 RepID=UPI003CCD8B28
MFFTGTLQEGITLAVQESKAVVCFVPDNGETSSTWQEDYFQGDEEFTRLLESQSVLLRIAKDSQEAGFLASVCPISKYPTVVVIRNGMLREYIVPDISKEDFRSRVMAAIADSKPQSQTVASLAPQQSAQQAQDSSSPAARAPQPVTTAPTPAIDTTQTSTTQRQLSQNVSTRSSGGRANDISYSSGSRMYSATVPRKQEREHDTPQSSNKAQETTQQNINETKGKAPIRTSKNEKPKNEKSAAASPAPHPTSVPVPPSQYRLQVRLFDGSSVRSTFSPLHTIRSDVRPWLDNKLEEKRPYNLKLIQTPLPNKTLTIAEEDQVLRELISGPTATFVMVPIKTYTEAYSDSGSLPVRAVSSAYGLVTSVVGGAVGYIGSFIGYSPNRASSESAPPQSREFQDSADATRRPRRWGANIRTLGDQRDAQDSQFYNGNQLNFEPRQGDDR